MENKWNKSGQKPRFLKTCDIIEVDGKHICGLFSMFGSVRQNRDSDETKFPFFGILWYNKNEEETIFPSLCLAAEKMRKICGKNAEKTGHFCGQKCRFSESCDIIEVEGDLIYSASFHLGI